MTNPQVTDRVDLSSSFQGDWIEISDFGVLKVQLHDVGMACGEDDLRNFVGCFEVVRVGVAEVVKKGLESVFVSWWADFVGYLGKLQQNRGLRRPDGPLYHQLQFEARHQSVSLLG